MCPPLLLLLCSCYEWKYQYNERATLCQIPPPPQCWEGSRCLFLLLVCIPLRPRADPPQLGDSRVNIDTQRGQLVTSELISLGITG